MYLNIGSIIQLIQEQLLLTLTLSLPLVLATSFSGLLIGLIQAVTQIQDQTIQFLVKLIVFSVVMALSGSWMMQSLTSYTQSIMLRI